VGVGRVLVTNGALHGLTLALGAVVDPGDVVVVDDPVFPDTARIVENAGGTVVGVAVDDEGLDVDAVERVVVAQRAAGRRVKAVYTVPDYQNPSGHVLSTARREQLVRLADEHDLLVVSDNPYRLHGLDDRVLPDFPDSDRVVRVSTFSKTLGPGLRLGWVVAPAWLAPHLVNVRRRVDFHSTTLTQAVVADLLGRDGWFDGLVSGARAIYRHRAATLVGSLRAHAGHVLEFTDPVGGFFVWARVVAPGVGARALSQALGEQGFVVPDGSPFAVSAGSAAHGYLRIAYSQAAVDDLAAAGPAVAEAAVAVSTAASPVARVLVGGAS
jgi:2-aminoadipate transaminase